MPGSVVWGASGALPTRVSRAIKQLDAGAERQLQDIFPLSLGLAHFGGDFQRIEPENTFAIGGQRLAGIPGRFSPSAHVYRPHERPVA